MANEPPSSMSWGCAVHADPSCRQASDSPPEDTLTCCERSLRRPLQRPWNAAGAARWAPTKRSVAGSDERVLGNGEGRNSRLTDCGDRPRRGRFAMAGREAGWRSCCRPAAAERSADERVAGFFEVAGHRRVVHDLAQDPVRRPYRSGRRSTAGRHRRLCIDSSGARTSTVSVQTDGADDDVVVSADRSARASSGLSSYRLTSEWSRVTCTEIAARPRQAIDAAIAHVAEVNDRPFLPDPDNRRPMLCRLGSLRAWLKMAKLAFFDGGHQDVEVVPTWGLPRAKSLPRWCEPPAGRRPARQRAPMPSHTAHSPRSGP